MMPFLEIRLRIAFIGDIVKTNAEAIRTITQTNMKFNNPTKSIVLKNIGEIKDPSVKIIPYPTNKNIEMKPAVKTGEYILSAKSFLDHP